MWSRIIGRLLPDGSRQRGVLIFKGGNIKTDILTLEDDPTNPPVMRYHMPEAKRFEICCSEKLRPRLLPSIKDTPPWS